MHASLLSLLALAATGPSFTLAAAPLHSWPQRAPVEPKLENRAFQLFTTIGTAAAAAATGTGTAAASSASASGAHSQSLLTAPSPPGNQPTTVIWTLWETADALTNPAQGNTQLSVKQKGNFLGYSIELSVANQVLGPSSTELRAPFLNFLQNLRARTLAGPRLRIGGNSQEGSVMYPINGLPNGGAGGSFLEKAASAGNPTNTPDVWYTEDLIYSMSNVTHLVGAEWLMGLAFANSTLDGQQNAMSVATFVEDTLGSSLIGYQIGNEPDLYAGRRRGDGYGIQDWFNEIGSFLQSETITDPNLENKNNFFLPSVCCNWSPQQMLETGFLDTYGSRMNTLSFQHYPAANCGEKIPGTAQLLFPEFLNHTINTNLIQPYIDPANQGISRGLDVSMVETNTASCSGFEGLSDSFGAALWALDWSLTLAYRNFTSAYLHVGGRDAFYNPFTAVQTNQSSFRGWTVGPVYYTTLAMAEIMGSNNASQVVDLTQESNSIFFPAYAIYENNAPTKVALFNFISDTSGASDYTSQISVGGVQVENQQTGAKSTPTEVYVRYMYSESGSTAEQYAITWANQTAALAGDHSSDGTLYNDKSTVTIPCATDQTCFIPMKAPSFALVFLTKAALDASSGNIEAATSTAAQTTFGTTYALGGVGTATVAEQVLATSNGRTGDSYGSTSKGSVESALKAGAAGVLSGSFSALAAVVLATTYFLAVL